MPGEKLAGEPLLERVVHNAARSRSGAKIGDVREAPPSRSSRRSSKTSRRGIGRGRCASAPRYRFPLLLALLPVFVGGIKIWIGLSRGKSIEFLVVLGFIALFVALIGLRAGLCAAGSAMQFSNNFKSNTSARQIGPRTTGLTTAEFATIIGLFGMTALAGSELDDLRKSCKPPGGGSGCGSSCGSGCGEGAAAGAVAVVEIDFALPRHSPRTRSLDQFHDCKPPAQSTIPSPAHPVRRSECPNTEVKFEVFEGPLDLLLYLIKKEEVDIYSVNLTKLATQFIEYIEMMREFDLEIAGEFLVMASTLMASRARELLPVEQQAQVEDEEAGEDPRWELIRQLVEYKKFKDAAAQLQTLEARREGRFPPTANQAAVRGRESS